MARRRVEGWRLLNLLYLRRNRSHWFFHVPFVHMLLIVVFKLLPLGREDFLALCGLD